MKLNEIANNVREQVHSAVKPYLTQAAGAVHSRLGNYLNQQGGKISKKKSKKNIKRKKKNSNKKIKLMGGNQNGPYAALMNRTNAYARFGAPGTKYWDNGINIEGSSIRGPTPLACSSKKFGGKRNRKYFKKL